MMIRKIWFMFVCILNAYRHEKNFKSSYSSYCYSSMGHWMPVKQVRDLNSLSLQNVEALASGETPIYTSCIGTGSVDCPIQHDKVKYVSQGFSLDY